MSSLIAPEESQTQPKLWPRLPSLCQQGLELRSWVPSCGEGRYTVHRQYGLRLGVPFSLCES